MSKPWDNEKTPTTDEMDWYDADDNPVVDTDTSRNLERRMRHAEALLTEVVGMLKHWTFTTEARVSEHLSAARQEDAQ